MVLTLLDALDMHSKNRPHDVFLNVWAKGDRLSYTFEQFRDEAIRFASDFKKLNLPPGSVIFIVLPHRPELYFAFIGAMYAGYIPSMLPFPTPKQDSEIYWEAHKALFRRVRPGAILTYTANIEPLKHSLIDLPTIVVDVEEGGASSQFMPNVERQADMIALLQHSSGTTGLKKGVELRFRDIQAQAISYSHAIALTERDVVVSWLPLYHDMGLLSSFLIPLSIGASIVSLDAFEWVSRPLILFDAIREHKGTLVWQPNFAFNHMARLRGASGRFDISTMRAFISCSEPCKVDTFDRFYNVFCGDGLDRTQLQTCYAMAETVFAVSQSRLTEAVRSIAVAGDALDRTGTIEIVGKDAVGARPFMSNGTPIAGLDVAILTEGKKDIWKAGKSSSSTGEILLRGKFVFEGYYKNPESNAGAFDDGWYCTGDIGFFNEGELFVCGRKKEILIVHGRNYYANDVEEVVSSVDGVKPGRAVAFSLYNDKTQSEEAIVMVESSVAADDHARLKRAVKQAVFDRLELTLHSVNVVNVGWLHKTTSGKVSRKENVIKYLKDREARA